MNSIFVGNLSFAATKDDVRKLFEGFGIVTSVLIMKGKKDKSRGFGFVDMAQEDQAKAAIAGLEGKEFMGRPLSLSSARPRVEKPTREFIPNKTWKKSEDSKPWDKRKFRPKSFNKFDGPKPWVKKEDGARPYRKDDRDSKPWDKNKGGSAPFKKFSDSKPWAKKENSARPYRKDDRGSKPWDKNKEGSAPFRKFGGSPSKPARPGGSSKSWQKNEARPKSQSKKF